MADILAAVNNPDSRPALDTLKDDLKLQADIRTGRIDWGSYQTACRFSGTDVELLTRLEAAKSADEVVATIKQGNASDYARVLWTVLSLSVEPPVRKSLLLIADALKGIPEFKTAVIAVESRAAQPYSSFLRLLNRTDLFILQRSSRILAGLLREDPENRTEIISQFLEWTISELRTGDAAHIQLSAQALSLLLSRDDYKEEYHRVRIYEPLFNTLHLIRQNPQPTYHVLFCLWILTFHTDVVEALHGNQVVAVIHDYLRTSKKEKLIRLALFIFQNITKDYRFLTDSISLGVIVTLEKLERRSFADPDIKAAIEPLKKVLEHDHVFLSSFDDYRQEVLSQHLENSHCHTSEKFWKENLGKFEADDYFILRALRDLLSSSPIPETLTIALNDVGQFIRYHARGRKVIEDLGFKPIVMKLLTHANEDVQQAALLTVQKMMVKNWEYLG